MKFLIIRMKEKTWKDIKKHCEVVYDICRNINPFLYEICKFVFVIIKVIIRVYFLCI